MASKQYMLIEKMEREAWVRLRKATEMYEADDKKLTQARAKWSILSEALDNLEAIEDSEVIEGPTSIKAEIINQVMEQRISEAYEKIAYMTAACGKDNVQTLCARREWYGMKKLEEAIRTKEVEILHA